MPFLPNFFFIFPKVGKFLVWKEQSSDLQSITRAPGLLNIGEEKQFACTSVHQISEERMQL